MTWLRTVLTLGLLSVTAHGAAAQNTEAMRVGGSTSATSGIDQRWEPFLGCWRPSRSAANDALQLCIVPSADGVGMRRVTYSGNQDVLTDVVVADGTARTVVEQACTGTRASRWSVSGSRLLMSSTLQCPNAPTVTTSGLSVMVSADQWLDVQTIKTDARGEQTRVQRFWRSDLDTPTAVAAALGARLPPRTTPSPTTVDDVIDASSTVDASVLEAWLSEGAVRTPIDRRALLQLSRAKVDARVIDLMVALAYPKKFEVRRQTYSGGASGIGMMSDFFPGGWGMLASQYGLGYGIYGVPYFYGAYGFGQPGGIYFIESAGGGTAVQDATHGQVINGRGYTRVQVREPFNGTATATSSTGGATNDTTGSGNYNGDAGASSGSSGASPSGYSGGGGSTGLTAVPR